MKAKDIGKTTTTFTEFIVRDIGKKKNPKKPPAKLSNETMQELEEIIAENEGKN